jgi:uncharacterized protein (TIRG00374 family)
MSTHIDSKGTPVLMSGRGTRRGVATFMGLTAIGLGAVFVFSMHSQVEGVVTTLSGRFFALALLAALMDFFIGGLRHYIFLRRLVPGTRIWLPIRADLIGRFTGAITPSQTGGGPGQIFVLFRGGIPLPIILSVLVINLMATMVFFVFFGGAAVWMLGDQVSSVAIKHLVLWGFVVVAGLIGFLALSVTRPDLAVRPIETLTRRLEGRSGAWATAVRRVGTTLVGSTEHYRASCAKCLRDWPMLPGIAVWLTVLMYLNKFTLGWFVMRGLGFEGPYVLTVAVQAVLHLILFAAPTPGGSGIAELSTGVLMALLLPAPLLAPFTLAYRLFLTYLPAAIGAVLLTHELRPGGRRTRAAGAIAATCTMTILLAVAAGPGAVPAEAQVRSKRSIVGLTDPSVSPATPYQSMVDTITNAVEAGILASSRADSLTAFDLAVHVSSELIRLAPEDAHAHYLYAVSIGQRLELSGTREKVRLGQQCREQAELALTLDPDHPGALHVLGRLHAGTMRLSRITRFVAKHLLGANALEGASWEKAEHYFTRAAELEPSNPRHWTELAQLYVDTGRPTRAKDALQRALAGAATCESERLMLDRAGRMLENLEGPR